jgi:hypothetical protein
MRHLLELTQCWIISSDFELHAFRGFNRPTSMAERVARRKDKPLPRLREADVEPLMLKLVDLGVNNCHYPYGDSDFRFCGLSKISSNPYCEPHMDLCYRPNVPKSLAVSSSLAA